MSAGIASRQISHRHFVLAMAATGCVIGCMDPPQLQPVSSHNATTANSGVAAGSSSSPSGALQSPPSIGQISLNPGSAAESLTLDQPNVSVTLSEAWGTRAKMANEIQSIVAFFGKSVTEPLGRRTTCSVSVMTLPSPRRAEEFFASREQRSNEVWDVVESGESAIDSAPARSQRIVHYKHALPQKSLPLYEVLTLEQVRVNRVLTVSFEYPVGQYETLRPEFDKVVNSIRFK
jgi:hypothetical protein